MYKIKIINLTSGETKELSFASIKEAHIYKNYHLYFGNWKNETRWVSEKNITKEEFEEVQDSETKYTDGNGERYYLLLPGWKIEEESATVDTITKAYSLYREKRNKYLVETDWTQLSDTDISTHERIEYRKYRQYLRNSPALHNVTSILNASPYSFEEWKNGKL